MILLLFLLEFDNSIDISDNQEHIKEAKERIQLEELIYKSLPKVMHQKIKRIIGGLLHSSNEHTWINLSKLHPQKYLRHYTNKGLCFLYAITVLHE